MAENKLLGTQQLNAGDVLNTINQVNTALKNLGKDVDLDLTKIVNAKVSAQLKETQRQIESMGSSLKKVGSSKGDTSLQKRIDEMLGIGKAAKSAKDSYDTFAKAELTTMQTLQKEQAKYMQQQERLNSKATIDAIKQRGKAEADAYKEAQKEAQRLQDYQKKWTNTLVSMAGAASVALLTKQWSEAVKYATEYYDRLNEIRIVTGKTEKESAKIGQDMRNLAKEMKVTSTELSKAAVTFYRQGLSDSEVQDRLKWVTEYAKVANIAFDEAAQLMTASINTMGDSIEQSGFANVVEHIADVWLYLGDNAATSGEEIGKAMQKASASATEFGLSFEWLGTYIATVSEQTRQAPESIGNAFNTMLARMHQIKASGFNDEDTTKLNDVAKALKTIDVELLDSEGQWRDMDKIYSDIAEKWGELDAKTKGYLATTMAGTRQQNVFYALMNDLSKGIEGGSRAQELYSGAIESAGTATQKFSIWQESIEASQSNMTNSLEQLYSNLKPDLIKGFYDMIALLVTGLNNLGGVIPVVIAGIAALATTIKMATTYANPLVALMAGAAAAVASLAITGGFGLFTGDLSGVDKYEEAVNKIAESQAKLTSLQSAKTGLSEMLTKVQSGAQLTTEEISKYNGALSAVASISPTAEQAVRNFTSGLGDQKTALEGLIATTEAEIAAQLKLQEASSKTALMNFTNSESYTTAGQYNPNNYSWIKDYDVYSMDMIMQYMDGKLADYVNGWLEAGTFEWNDRAGVKSAIDEFFSLYEGELAKATKEQAQQVIDNVIGALGQDVSSEQRGYLGEAILNMLMGDNGNLDYEDVAQERVREIFDDLIQGAKAALDDSERELRYFADLIQENYGIDINMFQRAQVVKTERGNPQLDAMGGVIYEIEELNAEAVKLMYTSLQLGVSISQITQAFNESQNVDEFIDKLKDLHDAAKEANKALDGDDGSGKGGDPSKAIKDYVDNITKASSQLDKIQSVRESIAKHETYNLSDVLDIAETNPEIIMMIQNLHDLDEALQALEETKRQAMKNNIIAMLMDSEEAFKNSGTSSPLMVGGQGGNQTVSTFAQLIKYYQSDAYKNIFGDQQSEERVEAINQRIASIAEHFVSMTTAADDFESALTGIDKVLEDLQNADKLTDAFKTLQDMENYDGTKAAEALKTIRDILGIEDLSEGEDISTWLENAKTQADQFTESANQAAEAYGILTGAEAENARAAEEARKAREDYINSMKDLSRSIADEIEANKASANGYANQIAALQAALSKGDVQAAAKQWKGFNDTIKSGLQKTYPQLAKVLADISAQEGSAAKNAQNLTKEQKSAEKVASAKYFKDSAKALYEVEAGTKTATEALSTFHSEEEKVVKAQLEYIDVSQKFAENTEVTASEVSALAEVLGWTPQALLDNWDMVAPMMDDIKSSMEELRSQFQEALWLNIVGSSDVDFSDVINGLVAVQDTADAAVQALLATGEFEIEEKDLEEGMNYFAVDSLFPFRGHWETASAKSTVQVLKPKGSPGLQKTGGGSGGKSGGGGSGGGGNKNEESEVTKMMNRMQEIYDLQKHTIDLYAAQANYFSETGQLQGVIKYYEKERKAVEDQNKIIEEQMAEMEPYLKQKEKEIKALDEASDEYKTCKSDLEKLQKQHQSYALELVNNKTKVEQLTKAIQEQQDAIRQLEIDIENELLQAIEDREALAQSKLQARIKLENEVYRVLQQQEEKQKRMLQGRINLENEIYRIIEEREALRERMLQGRIEMENTILDLLKQNAEEERDSILENTQSLIDALQKERDLLSEQLQLRKELAQEQEKQAKLAELEEKYSRISADPTRQKEALSIRKQIDDLRDEMGWDRAEKEVKARQKDIDDQIAALNKNIKKVQAYYDQLFKYPEKQIAQMQEILQKSDAEIIEWLKANDSSYATSTAATQKNMVNTWESSLRDMHGQTVTYWDEVSRVIKGTDDEIINWLMANDQTYQNSSAATRQSLLNGWQDMLSDMHGYNKDLWGQVEQIMEQYGDNITDWLEQNDEEFANKTKAQQEDMRNNWAQMLREMKGDIVTHWDEVHSIMEQGDDAIIDFLKANSAKYREASSAQASAYVDGWMQKLAALKSALASVTSDLIPATTYSPISGGSSSGSSSSGGGGGGGGGGLSTSGSSMQQATVNMIYKSIGENKILAQASNKYTPPTFSISGFIRSFSGYTYHHSEPSGTFINISPGGSYSVTYWYSKSSTQSTGASSTISSLLQTASSVKSNLPPLPQATAVDLQDNLASSSKPTVKPKVSTITFDTGGVPANEGQAYVHAKERILNPYQTELFESLVNTMDVMSHIMVPDMPDFNQSSLQNNSSVSVGDIIVNVDKMDTDADYEEMAERVLDAIMEKLNRGSVVGGIRFSR